MAIKSTQQKLEQCRGLIDTRDVSDWENGFLKSVCNRDVALTEKQLEVLDRIYSKHFA